MAIKVLVIISLLFQILVLYYQIKKEDRGSGELPVTGVPLLQDCQKSCSYCGEQGILCEESIDYSVSKEELRLSYIYIRISRQEETTFCHCHTS